ncbi:hypothetical protein ACHAXA_010690 [Cyclostephanos tholiformis]|uniref:Cas1p 10 TM acyl transferase domain-containing protein n=1 Tax=Cyclostephanos tholiformis TaxID=382380 RepID=A0ABD3SF12_9STRA
MGDHLHESKDFLQRNAGNASILADANTSTSTVAMAMFFGTIIFTTTSLASRLWLTGLWRWRNGDPHDNTGKGNDKSQPLDTSSLPSIYSLLYHFTVFGLILFYSYICEHHPPHFQEVKTYDRDEFFFWMISVIVFAGGHTLRRNDEIEQKRRESGDTRNARGNVKDVSNLRKVQEYDETQSDATSSPENEVLNHCQTDEWKGWMQLTFLMYHYTHATEIYNGIRVMTTCYLWMTGFGNFSFFYMTNDYSITRVLQMVWRLNFLVFFLCLTHGNPYILYYICPLHTYFFFMVYAVMFIGKDRNYTKWWIRIKLGVLALIIFFVWDCDTGIFEMMHQLFLSNEPISGAPMGSRWEWYFRSYLDHWSTFLGMIFALNLSTVSLFYRKLEAQSMQSQWMGKCAMAAGMIFAFLLWAKGPLMYSKIEYNSTNPYFGFIPLVTYIYLRNLTPKMRSYSMEFLHNIGKTTLETYLMQHHIWLTTNAKTILVFLPGWPRVNLALVTYLYVLLSRKLHGLTLHLRGMLLPNDRGACINSLVCMALTLSGFYSAAFLLEGMNMISLPIVGIVSALSGILMYHTIIDLSWNAYRKSTQKKSVNGDDDDDYTAISQSERSEYSTEQESTDETIYSKTYPPLIGALVLLVLGLCWSELAAAGASAIGPLPVTCNAFVNDGMWIPIDGCNESTRGIAYRNFGSASYGSCVPPPNSYMWAWKKQPSYTHCRFGHRNEEKLKQILNRREVIFIGDSMTRYVYHASMQAMGIKSSGAYDATGPKHADISNTLFETTPINFKWAPLAVDQLTILKDINRLASEDTSFRPPDLIVLGGGAWDLLHLYATDEDRQSHAAVLNELEFEMRSARGLGVAVVWLIPTTINSQALNTEEKRDHMREEHMESMRWVYARSGILSASSFVIDGPAFTSSRVSESYDGVHYPPQVYSAGAQILFNALDWLLPPGIIEPVTPPRIGKMANPTFGVAMLILVIIGLVGCDGFLGFSYLSTLFAKGVMPHHLYHEAFSALLIRLGLRAPDMVGTQTKLNPWRLNTSPNSSHPTSAGVQFQRIKPHRENGLQSIEEISELLGFQNEVR